MDWKSQIKDWCREFNIPSPTFLLSRAELKQVIKSNNLDEDLKTVFKDIFGDGTCKDRYGDYHTIEIKEDGKDARTYDIITITAEALNDEKELYRTLTHEFLHHFIEQQNLYTDRYKEFIERLVEKYDKLPIHKAVEKLLKKE